MVGRCLLVGAVLCLTAPHRHALGQEEVKECLEELVRLSRMLNAREIEVRGTAARGIGPSHSDWKSYEQNPIDRRGEFKCEITVWMDRDTVDLYKYEKTDGNESSSQLITLDGSRLYYDGMPPLSLRQGEAVHGYYTGPFFGVFVGPSRRGKRSFESWSQKRDWKTRGLDGGRIELSRSDQRREITLTFAMEPEVQLEHVHVEGAGNNIDSGHEGESVFFSDDYEFEYVSLTAGDGVEFFIPGRCEMTRRWKYESEDMKDKSYLLKTEAEIHAISAPKPELTKFGDADIDVPEGEYVQVDEHPGIDFEWRDGEIVRSIDGKKLESLRGYEFTGANWFLPVTALVLIAAIGGGVWWWKKRSV